MHTNVPLEATVVAPAVEQYSPARYPDVPAGAVTGAAVMTGAAVTRVANVRGGLTADGEAKDATVHQSEEILVWAA